MSQSDPEESGIMRSNELIQQTDSKTVDTYIKLAEMNRAVLFDRRRDEWRLIYGIWVACSVFTFAFVLFELPGPVGYFNLFITVVYAFTFVALCRFLWSSRKDHAAERAFLKYYQDMTKYLSVQGSPPPRYPSKSEIDELRRRDRAWLIAEMLVTLLFILFSWLALIEPASAGRSTGAPG